MKTTTRIASVFFLALICYISLGKCKNKKKCVPCSSDIAVSDLKLHEVNLQQNSWHLCAATSCFDKSGHKITCYDVSCTLKNGAQSIAQVNAEKSVVLRNKKLIHLIGPVNGSLESIAFLGTDVDYTLSTHLLKTKKKTTFTHKNFSVTSRRCSIDLKKKTIYLRGGVKSVISIK